MPQQETDNFKAKPTFPALCLPGLFSLASGGVGEGKLELVWLAVPPSVGGGGGSVCQKLGFCPGICSSGLLTGWPFTFPALGPQL